MVTKPGYLQKRLSYENKTFLIFNHSYKACIICHDTMLQINAIK